MFRGEGSCITHIDPHLYDEDRLYKAVTCVTQNGTLQPSSDAFKEVFMTILFSKFSKPLLAVTIALVATVALALPSPKDIEAAVNAGHNAQAEAMLREVIQEKPQSAKAHYELGQVLAREARYAEAQTELKKAKDIDPSLKFAASPDKFNDTLDKVSRLVPATNVQAAPVATPAPHVASPGPAPTESGGFSLTYVWLGIGALVVLALVLRRSSTPAPIYPAAMTPAAPMPQRGFGAQFTPNAPVAPGYAPGYGPGYAQPTQGTGSTVAGAVVGGLAGVAAGYALSKALEGDHHSAPEHSNASVGNNGGYVPFDTPAQPDLGSFDAGSGDTWDDASSSGGDDSW